ncbi:MAG: hypothetical protein ACYC4R_13480 [Anaerolineae bacterium]
MALVLLTGLFGVEADAPVTLNSGYRVLPPYESPTQRFGFDSGALAGYDVAQLGAGWYTDWSASASPSLPAGLTYVQTLRFTPVDPEDEGGDPHDPDQVTIRPDATARAAIAAAHPGSLWLLGNEPDSVFQGEPLEPAVYAELHHRLYTEIKLLDPTALVANGAIVQPTPCRLEYLDLVWAAHQATYGTPLPVDVWNIHAFILAEDPHWGGGIPPGVDIEDPNDPAYCVPQYYDMNEADNIDFLRENIVRFRQWMKDRGQQAKPLIVSEYGVLYNQYWGPDEDSGVWQWFPITAERVSRYMVETFDLFLWTADTGLGMPSDGYRLVQAWAWYSLSDTTYNGALFDSQTKTLTLIGQTFAEYTANPHIRRLWLPLTPKSSP